MNPVLRVNFSAYLVNGDHVRLRNPIQVINWLGFPILISLSLGRWSSLGPPLELLSCGQVVGNVILRQPLYKKLKGVVSLHASHSVPLVGEILGCGMGTVFSNRHGMAAVWNLSMSGTPPSGNSSAPLLGKMTRCRFVKDMYFRTWTEILCKV